MVAAGDGVMDGAVESIGIDEGGVGEIMLLEVAPASLDVVQFGGVCRQPLEGQPGRWASARVVSRLRWIAPLSRTATSGRFRSAVP